MIFGGSIIDWLGQNIADLLPVRIVRSYQRGVRFWMGEPGPELGPGWYCVIPLLLTLEVVDTRSDTTNLPTQSLTLRDGNTVTVSANVEFHIADAVAYLTNVQQFDYSLANIAMNHIAKKMREWTWAELVDEQKALERSLRETMTTRAKPWGVRITDVGITDLARAKTIRLYGDPTVG